uniref:sushi domain-containing protein 4-like n=1 Tax=Myxine glutinosa TaxID=7769 RepID=UPI00358F1FD2
YVERYAMEDREAKAVSLALWALESRGLLLCTSISEVLKVQAGDFSVLWRAKYLVSIPGYQLGGTLCESIRPALFEGAALAWELGKGSSWRLGVSRSTAMIDRFALPYVWKRHAIFLLLSCSCDLIGTQANVLSLDLFCPEPGIPLYGSRSPPTGTFFELSVIRYSCHAGHSLVGPAMSTCLRRAHGGLSWFPSELPSCQLTTCQTPAIAHGHAFDYNYTANSTLLAWCTSGLHLTYPAASAGRATCLLNGSWDVLPTCRGCETPLPVGHSWVSENVSLNGTYPVGSSLLYTCYPGYSLHGAQRISCTKHLTWSQEPPTCLPSQSSVNAVFSESRTPSFKVCTVPKRPENGYFLCHPSPCDRYVSRTVLEYYCTSGYTLKGDYKFHTCQDGVWSPPLQVSCLPSQETLAVQGGDSATSPWAIVAATASSVVLILLLITLLVLLQPRLKSLRHNRRDDEVHLIVDGLPVALPSYEEAVASTQPSSAQPSTQLPESNGQNEAPGAAGPLPGLNSPVTQDGRAEVEAIAGSAEIRAEDGLLL